MDDPPGFKTVEDIIYSIDQSEAPLAARTARIGAQQVMDELARNDPKFAAELRASRRRMKAWRHERDQLAKEMARLQTPLVVAMLNPKSEALADMAGAILRVSDYLFEHDAPAGLIRGLLQASQRMLE